MQISSAVLQLNPTRDNAVAVKIMSLLSGEIGEALLATELRVLSAQPRSREGGSLCDADPVGSKN
jgi:hypothetical protein